MQLTEVCAVIVAYHPDLSVLQRLLTSLSSQVGHILLLDNSASNKVETVLNQQLSPKSWTYLHCPSNIGVAAGHNLGIRWAESQQFKYAILFDQDSEPAEDMVSRLMCALQSLAAKQKVAAVGPVHVDARTMQPATFLQFSGLRIKKRCCQWNVDGNKYIKAEFLITSGTLLEIAVFHQIGEFDEGLFINNNDLEWCLRAKSKGYICFGVCDAIMHHRLGDNITQILGMTIHHNSPYRHYYNFRNRVLIYRRSYIPLTWKINDAPRMCVKILFHILFTKPRWQHLQMIMRGIWDGICGRSGKLIGRAL